MIRRTLIISGIIGISLLLAFPLRDAVYATIIVPVAYLFWLLGLFYHSVHQSFWWGVAFLAVFIMLIRGLLPQYNKRKVRQPRQKKVTGQVETLSVFMKKAERGIYFKWLVANRIGRVAHQILTMRDSGRKRSFFDPLTGPGWEPDEKVQSYLEAGLQGSFADYPQSRNFFPKPIKTPMDHDISEVVDFLETMVEK